LIWLQLITLATSPVGCDGALPSVGVAVGGRVDVCVAVANWVLVRVKVGVALIVGVLVATGVLVGTGV
jgi:hypothetical protein